MEKLSVRARRRNAKGTSLAVDVAAHGRPATILAAVLVLLALAVIAEVVRRFIC